MADETGFHATGSHVPQVKKKALSCWFVLFLVNVKQAFGFDFANNYHNLDFANSNKHPGPTHASRHQADA